MVVIWKTDLLQVLFSRQACSPAATGSSSFDHVERRLALIGLAKPDLPSQTSTTHDCGQISVAKSGLV